MRKAIVYASVHHGNTEKLVKRIAEECQVDLIDAVKQSDDWAEEFGDGDYDDGYDDAYDYWEDEMDD